MVLAWRFGSDLLHPAKVLEDVAVGLNVIMIGSAAPQLRIANFGRSMNICLRP